MVVEHSGALIKTPGVPRPPKSKALAVEMMAELVTKGAEKRAVRGDLFTDGGPHPKTYEHGFGIIVPKQLDRSELAEPKRTGGKHSDRGMANFVELRCHGKKLRARLANR